MKQATGTVYLIPIPVAEGALHTLSPEILKHTLEIKHFFAENVRTARRFLKALHPALVIEEINFSEIDKREGADMSVLKQWLNEGHSIGIMSEAGCPGIADPGAEVVAVAHRMGAKVVPLTGPSSLLLALMASGLNGQSFCFSGYLPVKDPDRSQRIKALELISRKEKQTQLFIETPYRNNALLDELLKHCGNETRLCVAQNITAPDEYIRTMTINDWKKNKPTLQKQPAIFLILAN